MAAWWLTPRLRHWIMQGSLWVVLAGTLALAAALRHHYLERQRVRLGSAVDVGSLQIPQPLNWTPRRVPDGLIFEEPPSAGHLRRRLAVHLTHSDWFVSPIDYLVRNGDLHLRDVMTLLTAQSAQASSAIRPISIAGWPGVLLTRVHLLPVEGTRRPLLWKQMLACAMLPGGRSIVMELEGQGVADPSDEDLVRRVAELLSLQGLAPPKGAERIELAEGISLKVPRGLATADEMDPFRTARVLVEPASSSCLAIEAVPCIFLPGDKPEALASMLLLRDPSFGPGQIRQIDPNTWMCQRKGEAVGPAIAYLRTHKDGRAILVEFRWDRWSGNVAADVAHVASLWQNLSSGIEFQDHTDLGRLLKSGAAAIQAMPADPKVLLNLTNPIEQWQWYHQTLPKESLTRIRYSTDDLSISVMQETDNSPPLGGSGREITQWRLARDWSAYEYRMDRLSRVGSRVGLTQETRVSEGKITCVVREGRKAVGGSGDVPPLYVPGGILPLVLGQLPFEPMILRSESVPTPVSWTSPAVLTLILEPAFDLPKILPGQSDPMRCWVVRVSGSGQSSRWYFDGGRLHAISFAGGIHVHRLDPDEVLEAPATQPVAAEEGRQDEMQNDE